MNTDVASRPAKSKRKTEVKFDSYLAFKFKDIWLGLRQEPWSFWFFCLYLLLEYTRIHAIYPIFSVLPIPWLQMTLLTCLALIIIGGEKKWVKSPATLPFMLFFVHVLLSSAFAYDWEVSLEYLPTMVNWLLLYYCMMVLVTTHKRFFIIILILVLASFKMANHATLSYVARGFEFERWGIAGPPGWFGNAADLAVQILIYIALVVALLIICRDKISKWYRLAALYMIGAGFLTIIAAGNRGTIVGMVPMVLYVLLFLKNRIRNFSVLAVVAIILVLASPAEFKERFETAGTDTTSVKRLGQWQRGVQAANKYPILGIGYENWLVYQYKIHRIFGLVAHSAPITALTELGYIGLFWYLLLHFTAFLINIKTRKIARSCGDYFSEIMSISLNVGLMGFAAASLFISIQYYPFLYVQLALSAALLNIVKKYKAEQGATT